MLQQNADWHREHRLLLEVEMEYALQLVPEVSEKEILLIISDLPPG